MIRKVQVTRLKEQIHKLHDERDDFQLREAKLTQENSRYDDTLRYITLRYVTFQVPPLCLGKMAINSPLVLRGQVYLNLQSWTKVLGQICICRAVFKMTHAQLLPSPNKQLLVPACMANFSRV